MKVEGNSIVLDVDGMSFTIELNNVRRARLKPNLDELK
jgi:ribosome maturation factor RimP